MAVFRNKNDKLSDLRRAVLERLRRGGDRLPVSGPGRLARTALSAARSGRLLSGADGEAIDVEALAALVASIGQLKGVAMKLGQIMSYIDVALPDELREALATLQTHSQPMPFETVEAVVREELGEAAQALLEPMTREPIAAASIGQVHRSRLPDGTAVVVKVQYPEIARAVANDFGMATLGARIPALVFPSANVQAMIAEARARLLEECDYVHEARMQQRFAALYAEHPTIHVPEVHERYSARRVLTQTFVDAIRFDDFLASDPPQAIRDRVGVALFEFYVGSLFRHRLYNCDPHPGNYLLREDGALTVLDYGCCREFDADFVAKLARLTEAVHADRRDALHAVFLELSMVDPGKAYDFATARDLVRAFYGPMLRDEVQAIDLGAGMQMRQVMERKLQLMRLRLPPEFLFLFRIRFGLLSVLAQLGTRANWYRLEQEHSGVAG